MSNFWIMPGCDAEQENQSYELWRDENIVSFFRVDDPIILAAIWRLQF